MIELRTRDRAVVVLDGKLTKVRVISTAEVNGEQRVYVAVNKTDTPVLYKRDDVFPLYRWDTATFGGQTVDVGIIPLWDAK